jgi:hypothetical protein
MPRLRLCRASPLLLTLFLEMHNFALHCIQYCERNVIRQWSRIAGTHGTCLEKEGKCAKYNWQAPSNRNVGSTISDKRKIWHTFLPFICNCMPNIIHKRQVTGMLEIQFQIKLRYDMCNNGRVYYDLALNKYAQKGSYMHFSTTKKAWVRDKKVLHQLNVYCCS